MTDHLAYMRAGARYRYYGLPGQPDDGAILELHSTTRTCALNTQYWIPPDPNPDPQDTDDNDTGTFLMTIRLADFQVAIEAGWIRYITEPASHTIQELFASYPIRHHPTSDPPPQRATTTTQQDTTP